MQELKKKIFPYTTYCCTPLLASPSCCYKRQRRLNIFNENFLCVDLKKTFQGIHLVHVFILYCYLKKYKQILIHLFEFWLLNRILNCESPCHDKILVQVIRYDNWDLDLDNDRPFLNIYETSEAWTYVSEKSTCLCVKG